MTNYIENGIYKQELPELMAQGLSNSEIMAKWDISRGTFYRWIKEHQEFKEAYEIGWPKRRAYYVAKARECWLRGDDKGFRYFKQLVDEAAEWKGEEGKNQVTNQININNMNMFDNESRDNLISYCSTLLQKLPVIKTIEVNTVEDKSGSDEVK